MRMVKVLTLINRKAGIPVGEFQHYWLTRHPLVVTRLPGIRRYVQFARTARNVRHA